MKNDWLPYAVLRAASLLAPGEGRAEWVREWQSELWYVPRRRAISFCVGAFRDALWLRRNGSGAARRKLDSPLSCLAALAAFAAASISIAMLLPAPRTLTASARLTARDLPEGCAAMLMLSCLMLPLTRLAMGRAPANRHPAPWPGRLRRWTFLALKIALVQPIMLCGFIVLGFIGQVTPVAPMGICAGWMLAFRWVLADQRRRCPVCLRLLTDPVRIGAASQTFLEWYGAESMCSRGHGLLQTTDLSTVDSGKQQWLGLDASWSVLFSEAAGVRHR